MVGNLVPNDEELGKFCVDQAAFKVSMLGVGDSTALLRNSILSIKRAGIPPKDIIVGRFRSDTGNEELAETGVTIFFLEILGFATPPKGHYIKYGSTEFSELMNIRFFFLQHLLRCGHLLICADVDVVWFRNPMPCLERPCEITIGRVKSSR